MESIHQLALFGHFERLKQEYTGATHELVGSLKKALTFMEEVYHKEGSFNKPEAYELYHELGDLVTSIDKDYPLSSEILEIHTLQRAKKPMQKAVAKPSAERAKKKKLG